MDGASQFGRELKNFGQGFRRKRASVRFVYVLNGHPVRQTFKDQRNGQPGPPDGQSAAEQVGIRHDPLVLTIRKGLAIGHGYNLIQHFTGWEREAEPEGMLQTREISGESVR